MNDVPQSVVDLLNQPLDASFVKQRRVSGTQVDYIPGHVAIREANTVFGFLSWSTHVIDLSCIGQEKHINREGRDGHMVGYRAIVRVDVRVGDRICTQEDVGLGKSISYSDPIEPHDTAAKEAVTDATKRCLRKHGDRFGLALYDDERKNVVSHAAMVIASDIRDMAIAIYAEGAPDYINNAMAKASASRGQTFKSIESMPQDLLDMWHAKLTDDMKVKENG